ncbi:MAG TPA: hypothetical protein VFP62_12645 [Burkholderiales bacterium]|jgi:hypothetical protein|nr:hypothetical protein [Burkholderiales bacterium]
MNRYAAAVDASKRVRWEIDRDVIRGREIDFSRKFLPDGLALVERFGNLNAQGRRLASQIQGRTYANMFGLVERFIGAKFLQVSKDHCLGDQKALEALVRSADEEIKHQELFRRLDAMMAVQMPAGYSFVPEPNVVAEAVLGKSAWSVLGLTCLIELFVMAHYRTSIAPDTELSELWKDVFMHHWREESQHAIVDELEWRREHEKLDEAARDRAVDDLIALAGAVDGLLQIQASADAEYFNAIAGMRPTAEAERTRAAFLAAYRWQYLVSGVQEPRFAANLASLTTPAQRSRIGAALEPIIASVGSVELRMAA